MNNRVIIQNCGDVFSKGKDWYMFYCPSCGATITRTETISNGCPKCGCLIGWPKARCPFGCGRYAKVIKGDKYTDVICAKCGPGTLS